MDDETKRAIEVLRGLISRFRRNVDQQALFGACPHCEDDLCAMKCRDKLTDLQAALDRLQE